MNMPFTINPKMKTVILDAGPFHFFHRNSRIIASWPIAFALKADFEATALLLPPLLLSVVHHDCLDASSIHCGGSGLSGWRWCGDGSNGGRGA
jgi:hypothetical protein